nr:hypothetical protein [Escherichia coli]
MAFSNTANGVAEM